MSRIALTFAVAAAMLLTVGQPAGALSTRTYVSADGSNASTDCRAAAPCRTFAGALAKTSAGGVITVLDAGDFGRVTIDQSVSIVAEGVEAGIQVADGSTGITVNAGATDIVVLRGL